MFEEINLSLIRENTFDIMNKWGLWLSNAVLSQETKEAIETLTQCKIAMKNTLNIVKLLICGEYGFKKIMPNDFYEALCGELFVWGKREDVEKVKKFFERSYMENPKSRCIRMISALIMFHYEDDVDIKKSAEKYFLMKDETVIIEIVETVRRGNCRCL